MRTCRAISILFASRQLNRPVVVLDPDGSRNFVSTVFHYIGVGAPMEKLPNKGVQAKLEIEYEFEGASVSLVKRAAFNGLDADGRMEFFANVEGYTATA